MKRRALSVYLCVSVVCAFFYLVPYYVHADQTVTSVTIVNGVPGTNTLGSSGRSNADRTPPVITSLTFADVTTRSIRIAWETSEPTMAVFRYGRTPEYEASSISSNGYTSTHVLSMSQLDPSAQYFLQVTVLDRSGNFAVKEGWFLLGPPMIVEDIIVDGVDVLEEPFVEEVQEEVEETGEDVVQEEDAEAEDTDTPAPESEIVNTPESTSEPGDTDAPAPPPQIPSLPGAPTVSVEDFNDVFGVEHVDQIPEERRLLPNTPIEPEREALPERESLPEPPSFFGSIRISEQVTRLISIVTAEPGKLLRLTTPGALVGAVLGTAISFIFAFLF